MPTLRPDARDLLARHLYVTSDPASEYAARNWDDPTITGDWRNHWYDRADTILNLITEKKP